LPVAQVDALSKSNDRSPAGRTGGGGALVFVVVQTSVAIQEFALPCGESGEPAL
jgi:hypothetical protein